MPLFFAKRPLLLRVAACECFALRMVIAELQRAREQVVHVNALANHLAGRRRLAFVNEVATAKLFGRQPNCVRNFIHLSLEREDTLRRAKTSESAVRRKVGSNSATVNPHVRTDVWTSSVDRSA